MSEKHSLPLPTQASSSPNPRRGRIALAVFLAFATLISLQDILPTSDFVQSTADSLSSTFGLKDGRGDADHSSWDEAYFRDHVRCPAQPQPIFPKMAWNMTDEEKRSSIDKYAQSVVSAIRLRVRDIRQELMSRCD